MPQLMPDLLNVGDDAASDASDNDTLVTAIDDHELININYLGNSDHTKNIDLFIDGKLCSFLPRSPAKSAVM
jgi:hypothetical protein